MCKIKPTIIVIKPRKVSCINPEQKSNISKIVSVPNLVLTTTPPNHEIRTLCAG